MKQRYSMAVQYLNCLQVTRGLTHADLTSPNILRACTSRLADTSDPEAPYKFTSKRFVRQGGKEIPWSPLEWPGLLAIETNLGPWRYDEATLRAAHRDAHSGCCTQEELTDLLVSEQLEANGYEQLDTKDGDRAATYDPNGVNKRLISHLDTAEWRLTRDQSISLRLECQDRRFEGCESVLSAHWTLDDGSSIQLVWDPDFLLEGCHLLRRLRGRPGTVDSFRTVPEALQEIALMADGPVDPIQEVRDGEGVPSCLIANALRRSVYATRIVNR